MAPIRVPGNICTRADLVRSMQDRIACFHYIRFMLILSAQIIEILLHPKDIIEAVRKGFIAEANGQYRVPERMHIGDDSFMYLLMPAFGEIYYGTKLVSVVSANRQKNLPIVRGTMTLNRKSDGATLAFMDATMITAIRTGAVGALGMEVISKQDISSVGIIGCGVQGIWQTICATQVRPIKKVFCYSRTKNRFSTYSEAVKKHCPELQLIWCPSGDEVVRKSDVVYACTTAVSPVFSNNTELVRDTRFISVGSFRPDMQELPDVVYKDADLLLIDSAAALREAGDVINAQKNGFIKKEQIITLGDVLAQKVKLKNPSKKVFKSVGMAAFDLAVASALYESADAKGLGKKVSI